MLGNGATNIIAPISTFAIASLFGDGLATYFSLQLGKGEPEKASKAVGNSVISGTVASVLLTVLEVLAFFLAAALVTKELKKMGGGAAA